MANVVLQFLYRLSPQGKFLPPPFLAPPPWWGEKFSLGTQTIQELKDNISHAVAAIKITVLHRVYLNIIRCAQMCIDAGGNHFQHILGWYILSAFGYCIHFCIYIMVRTRATFSWPTLYIYVVAKRCIRNLTL